MTPDYSTIDGLLFEFYDSISGPAGTRDWSRNDRLFLAGGRLVPTTPKPGGGASADVFDAAGYRVSREPFFAANDFVEREIGRRVERWGPIAQVWSAYQAEGGSGGFANRRSINAIQLFHDGSRWWIVSVLWANEHEGSPLPQFGASPRP